MSAMTGPLVAGIRQLPFLNIHAAGLANIRKSSHGRRNFFDLAKLNKAPIAIEAVRRIDELFEIERTINGKTPEQRVAVRQEKSKPLVLALDAWPREQRAKLSSKSETAKAINYCFTRWTAFNYSRRSLENRSSFVVKMFGATTFESAIQIHSEYAKTSYAGFIAYLMKMTDLRANLAKEFFKPIETAITKVQTFSANDA